MPVRYRVSFVTNEVWIDWPFFAQNNVQNKEAAMIPSAVDIRAVEGGRGGGKVSEATASVDFPSNNLSLTWLLSPVRILQCTGAAD